MRKGILLLVSAAVLLACHAVAEEVVRTAGDPDPWNVTTVSRLPVARPGAADAALGGAADKYLHINVDFDRVPDAARKHKFRVINARGEEVGQLWGWNDRQSLVIFEGQWDSLAGLYLEGLDHREPLFAVRTAAPEARPVEPAVPMQPRIGEVVERPAVRTEIEYPTRVVGPRRVVVEEPDRVIHHGPDRIVYGGPDRIIHHGGGEQHIYRDGPDRVVHHGGGGVRHVYGSGGTTHVQRGGGTTHVHGAGGDTVVSGGGSGVGSGAGGGPGVGVGSGPGVGSGDGVALADDVALADELGDAIAMGPGAGPGAGPGPAAGTAPAPGEGYGPGEGPGMAPGEGPGTAPGEGPGMAPGEGPGMAPGEGSEPGMAEDCLCEDGETETCPTDGSAPGEGPAVGPGVGPGEGPGEGPGTGPGGPGGPMNIGPQRVGPRVVGPRVIRPEVDMPTYRDPRTFYDPRMFYDPRLQYDPRVQFGDHRPGEPGYGGGPGGGGGGGRYDELARAGMKLELPKPQAPPAFVLYVAAGEEGEAGKVYQVDENGRVLGWVNLPFTPTGLALHRESGLVVSLPRDGGRLMYIDDTGKASTLTEKDKNVVHPVDVAVGGESDTIVVADNIADALMATSTGGITPKEYRRFEGQKWHAQDMSVAVTRDGHVIFGTDGDKGVYRYSGDKSDSEVAPILPEAGGVAADPKTLQWAATQNRNQVYVFEGEELMKTLRLPAGKSHYRNGLLSFSPAGSLCVVARDSQESVGEPWFLMYNIEEDEIRSLFPWQKETMTDFVVGPRMLWERNAPDTYRSQF